MGPREIAWTICVTSVGHVLTHPGEDYPQLRHPGGHYFTWERGRTLSALQLVVISKGSGWLEFSGVRQKVAPGSVFVLPPGCWHRYRPDSATGWTEDWVELRGTTPDAWITNGLLEASHRKIGPQSPVWEWIKEIHTLCRTHRSGFRPTVAGLAMALVAHLMDGESPDKENDLTHRAREILLAGHDVAAVASQLGVSYPTLYRHFKKVTGLGPKEYARKIRLSRAEDLIAGTPMSIKEVAGRLGFYSASHLSMEFKKANGIAPSIARNRTNGSVPG